MLSILIPVYRYNLVQFVQELHQSALEADIKFEIRVYDDASGTDWNIVNKAIDHLEHVIHKQFKENRGRSSMRNKLAEDAKYNYLLFIDGDSALVNSEYITEIKKSIEPDAVLVGKTDYRLDPPEDKQKHLRWLFGKERESIEAKLRQLNPYNAFKTHHFLIEKGIFQSIRFNEKIEGYGHEDTFFGFDLQKQQVKIKHLNFALYHEGLESADVFLKKTDQAIFNLFKINKDETILNTRLWKSYEKTKVILGKPFFNPILKVANKLFENKLTNKKPNLFLLDLYKLTKLFIISTENRN